MNLDPSIGIEEAEQTHLFLCYCTFVMNLKGKKLSIQNVFIHTLSNEKLKGILKDILNLDTDYEIVKVFLEYDGSISRSKYVTRFLNDRKK